MLAVGKAGEKNPWGNWGQEERRQNDKVHSLDTACSLWYWRIISDIRSSGYSTSNSGGCLTLRFRFFSVGLAMASYQNQRIQLWIGNWNSTANAPARSYNKLDLATHHNMPVRAIMKSGERFQQHGPNRENRRGCSVTLKFVFKVLAWALNLSRGRIGTRGRVMQGVEVAVLAKVLSSHHLSHSPEWSING